MDKENDVINKPSHYCDGKYECIKAMEMLFGKPAVIDFCKCNVFKYRWRAQLKNGKEDLEKADRYLEIMEGLMKTPKDKSNDVKKLKTVMYGVKACPDCGAIAFETANYCWSCGRRVEK